MNHIQMYFGRFLVQRLALLLRALTACSGLNTGRLAGCLWITSEMGRSDMGEFAQQDSDLFRHQLSTATTYAIYVAYLLALST